MRGSTEYMGIDVYELFENTLFIVRNIRAKIKLFFQKKKCVRIIEAYELIGRLS
jgi:hypothetical protein